MSLSVGIVGLPNVGKSTLFNALLKRQAALAANYPFATIEPNVGIVDVPDERLQKLAEIVKVEYGQRIGDREIPEKIIPAVIKFYDIAGLVKGASKGEGLGNQFLSHIREVDAIVQVVRAFDDENVIRAGSVNPKEDIEIINTELILSDLQSLEKKIEKAESDLKKSKAPDVVENAEFLKKLQETLSSGNLANSLVLTEKQTELLKGLNLLTSKPMIYIFNISEDNVNSNITQGLNLDSIDGVSLSARVESELCSFDEKEQNELMKSYNISESGLDKVIKKCYEILGLETYLTAGPKEVRAWTYTKGLKAPQAAGIIHTDFERGFISAEVVSYKDLVSVGGWKNAKDKGLIRIEGKSYTMHDGDVVEFRFSV